MTVTWPHCSLWLPHQMCCTRVTIGVSFSRCSPLWAHLLLMLARRELQVYHFLFLWMKRYRTQIALKKFFAKYFKPYLHICKQLPLFFTRCISTATQLCASPLLETLVNLHVSERVSSTVFTLMIHTPSFCSLFLSITLHSCENEYRIELLLKSLFLSVIQKQYVAWNIRKTEHIFTKD